MRYGKRSRDAPPEWYATVKVAEQMHVPPWEVDPDERIMPWEWSARVLLVMNVEAEAAEYHRKQAERKQRMKRR